jgi:hypothetical protein
MSKKIVIIVITAIVFFGLGYFISPSKIITKEAKNIIKGEDTYQAGWEAAKQRLAESNFMPTMIMKDIEIKSVSGSVQKIEGNKITLKIQPLEPLADPDLDIRIIDASKAKFYKSVQRDMEEYQKEMDEFNLKIQAQMNSEILTPEELSAGVIAPPEMNVEPIMPPAMFIKKEVSISEIQNNQQITVITEEDIKDKKEFKAIEVSIQ